MKNVAIYLTPNGVKYDSNTENIIRIWIDNSFSLGWKQEDIILVNNFPYEYNGIKSIIVPNENFCPFRPGSSKTISAAYLLKEHVFSGDDIWWVHDPDAFQLNPIGEDEIWKKLKTADVGFTNYGWSPKWSLGSYFFKESAMDIFWGIKETIYAIHNEDERALVSLVDNKVVDNSRIEVMNITYNFGKRRISHNWSIADKPVRVLHFRPYDERNQRVFIRGENELGFNLMPERLLHIFKMHGLE